MNEFNWDEWGFGDQSKLVVLTGAGVSAESGIKTFRDSNGLWENHKIEEVATPEGFYKNPNLVIDFYNQRRKQLFEVEPNAAHFALARLEDLLKDRFLLVTQNVDDLHERAGSKNLIHMHGELLSIKCNKNDAHKLRITNQINAFQKHGQKCSQCNGFMRPDIVWFGEIPYDMDSIYQKLLGATHFVYIGTSSTIYPAAGFKEIASSNHLGAKVLGINLEVDFWDQSTGFYLQGQATEMVPLFVSAFN